MATDPDPPQENPPPPPPVLEHPDPTSTLYLEIEEVVAAARNEDIPQIFSGLRDRIATLKGARAENGKKVLKALERTEELFQHLIRVRERMTEGEPKP